MASRSALTSSASPDFEPAEQDPDEIFGVNVSEEDPDDDALPDDGRPLGEEADEERAERTAERTERRASSSDRLIVGVSVSS